MPGPPPKANAVRRNGLTFAPVLLPAEGRIGRAPRLPPLPRGWSSWSKPTRDWWAWLWSTPQATQWDQSGRTLHAAMVLRQANVRDPLGMRPRLAELRQIEDRHGLSPKALLALRWSIAAVQPARALQSVPDTPATALIDRMRSAPTPER